MAHRRAKKTQIGCICGVHPFGLEHFSHFRVIRGTTGCNSKTVHCRVKRTKFGPWVYIYTHMSTFDLEHVKIILPFFFS